MKTLINSIVYYQIVPLEHLCMLQNLYVVVWYFEGIKPISNFFLFFYEKISSEQKRTKTHKNANKRLSPS